MTVQYSKTYFANKKYKKIPEKNEQNENIPFGKIVLIYFNKCNSLEKRKKNRIRIDNINIFIIISDGNNNDQRSVFRSLFSLFHSIRTRESPFRV